MSTNLEKAKRRRIKVTQYYANGMQFIIRLLMGLGMYIVLRIGLYAFLTHAQGIAFTFGDALAEIFILLVTAILVLLFIWIKGTRSHLAAAIWMPAIACLAVSDLIRFFLFLPTPYNMVAWYGFLPFVLPLILMVLYWAFDPENIWIKLLATVLFLGMTIFWITDVPKSFDEARHVQTVVQAYQGFAEDLKKDHIVSWDRVPQSIETGEVLSLVHTKPVDPLDYLIDEEIKGINGMYYVVEADIIINGLDGGARVSSQNLNFNTLDQVNLHYFFKYSTTRKIVLKDFQYTGDAFFLLELNSGEKIIVDNVLIRKKSKE
jgi:hypothetical protein